MADELGTGQTLRGIHWRDAFPFTHLFRGFRIAIHPSKLVLGLVLLLLLYGGGRLLDGLWNERDLAVPGEVQAFEEQSWQGGASRGEFARWRRDQRLAIENDYADRLVAAGVVTDRAAALAAAEDGERLGQLKDKIVAERDRLAGEAQTRLNQDLEAAGKLPDEPARDRARADARRRHEQTVRGVYRAAYDELRQAKQVNGTGIFHAFFEYEVAQISGVTLGVVNWNWLGGVLGRPEPNGVFTCLRNFLIVGPLWLVTHHPLYFVLFSLLFLTLWAVFGGAIARIAAVHAARDEKLSVRAALQFSIGKFLSFVSAPLIPLIIVLAVGLIPLVVGLLASIPVLGPVVQILMGLLFILLIACGFVMALVLFGTLGGLNLMYPTIAVEGSDSFDAISRSFSYVYARPWRMLLYTVIAVIYGALTYLFVRLFVGVMLWVTYAFLNAGMFAHAPSTEPLLPVMWPAAEPRLSYDVDFLTLRWDQDLTAALIAFWIYLIIGLLGAYVISYYFSASTIIYYLMRREVDATELDDVYLEQTDDDFGDAAPLAGPGSDGNGGGGGANAPAPAPAPAPPAEVTTTESVATTTTVVTTPPASEEARPDNPPA